MTPDTQLRALPDGDLRLECPACQHSATVLVSELIKQLGGATTLAHFQARIRCRNCGAPNPIVVISTQVPDGAEQSEEKRA